MDDLISKQALMDALEEDWPDVYDHDEYELTKAGYSIECIREIMDKLPTINMEDNSGK